MGLQPDKNQVNESSNTRTEPLRATYPIHLHIDNKCSGDPVPPGWLVWHLRHDPNATNCGPVQSLACNVMDIVRYDNLPVGTKLDVAYLSGFQPPNGWRQVQTYYSFSVCDPNPLPPNYCNRVIIQRWK